MADPTPMNATGDRISISSPGGETEVVVGTVAAVLRSVRVQCELITESFPDSQPAPGGCGITLVPWPNRVRDGVWMLDGEKQQLDITEVGRGNAIHGLARNAVYRVARQESDTVTLSVDIPPQHGYPFFVRHEVTYSAHDAGVRVDQRVTNIGTGRAPVALGAHPYLRVGNESVDDLSIELPAASRVLVDNRNNATGAAPVDEATDLRRPRTVRDLDLDTAYGDLAELVATVRASNGRAVELRAGAEAKWMQVFTSRVFPVFDADGRDTGEKRTALAVEPCTAPPDAFNSGEGVAWIDSGESFTLSWSIRALS